MFGGWAKRTPLAQGWAREWWKGVELLTYCYLGNSTKCSSPTPSPCRRLSLFLRFSLSSPFLHSPSTPSFSLACFFSLVHPFSFLSCSVHSLFYGRAASLQRGSVGVASISRTKKKLPSFRGCTHASIWTNGSTDDSYTDTLENHVESYIFLETRTPGVRFSVTFSYVKGRRRDSMRRRPWFPSSVISRSNDAASRIARIRPTRCVSDGYF